MSKHNSLGLQTARKHRAYGRGKRKKNKTGTTQSLQHVVVGIYDDGAEASFSF